MENSIHGQSTTFANVGGLKEQIQTIKDLILFPMKYKSMTADHNMRMPRGAIFHGPPGTGKTLVASSLATECSTVGGRKVTFISRKGTDILDCYVGESERRLRQVFARARVFAPAIIFFDELDALAPARSSLATSGGNQVHSSLVSVLLTEMDGVGVGGDDVFVVGATNRLETLDPALRRPGRFDRELRFTLPNEAERREIIRVHVLRWRPPVSDATVARLAAATHGHCGADLAAVCTEAWMCCLRRTQPPEGATIVMVGDQDFAQACAKLVPAAHRLAKAHARRMSAVVEPLYGGAVDAVVDDLLRRYPHAFLRAGVVNQGSTHALSVPRVLLTGDADFGHTLHLAPALLHRLEHLPVVTLDVDAVTGTHYTHNMACVELFRRVRSTLPCVLYAPDLTGWWGLVHESTRLMVAAFIASLAANPAVLVVATVHEDHDCLPVELRRLFGRGDVYRGKAPSDEQRRAFFAPLMLADGGGGDGESVGESESDEAEEEGEEEYVDEDTDDGDSSTSSHCSGLRGLPARREATAFKLLRSGRVVKATNRKVCRHKLAPSRKKQPPKKKPLASKKSPPPGTGPPFDPRSELLQRLVRATCGWGVLSLEQAYASLECCCLRGRQHQDGERLLAELEGCVASLEREAQERAHEGWQSDQPHYLS